MRNIIRNSQGLSPTWLRHERERVLQYASAVALDKTDATEVMQHVASLTKWMEEATGADDRKDRLSALGRAYENWCTQRPTPQPPGTPAGLLITAFHYYEYLAA
jgi:hypothetical protein